MENIPPKYFSLPLPLFHAQRGCVDFYICKVKDIFRFLNVFASFLFIDIVIIFRQEMGLPVRESEIKSSVKIADVLAVICLI